MLNFFKTARENARKAAEYDRITRRLDAIGHDLRSPLYYRVSLLADQNHPLGSRLSEANAKIARMTSGLKQFQPKAAAEKKVDA